MTSFNEFSKDSSKSQEKKDMAKNRIDPKTGNERNERNENNNGNNKNLKENSNPRTSSASDRPQSGNNL